MGKGQGSRGTGSEAWFVDAPRDSESAKDGVHRRLRRAEVLLASYKERNKQLDSRIAQLENQLQDERRKAAQALAEKRPTTKGKLDLNTATLHELRAVGLTITESARVIAHREILDGLDSLDVVDEIPELSADARDLLRECGGT